MRERNFGRGLAYTLAVMVFTVVMVQFALPEVLGSFVKRPEGAAFRFFEGVSTEEDAEVRRYGSEALAAPLLEFRRIDDGDWFERVEVGAGVTEGASARVPALLVRRDAESSSKRTKVAATAVLSETAEGEWRVVEVVDRAAGTLVPSEGGEHPARAPLAAWVAAIVVGVGLAAGTSVLLRALDRGTAAPAAAGAPSGSS